LNSFATLGDPALTALASSAHLGQLRTLMLGSGPWGPAGAKALGDSRTLTSLRALYLTQGNERARDVPAALLGQPLVCRLRDLGLNMTHIGEDGLAALASQPRPLRLRTFTMRFSGKIAASWEALLAKGLLARLTELSLFDPPSGALSALLAPGRLPELRELRLFGLPNLKEFQALLGNPLFGRLRALQVSLHFEQEERQGEKVIRRLTAAWNSPALRKLGLTWSLRPDQVRLLTAASGPPALTRLELGSLRMGVEGATALAGWPLLRQLRWLVLTNASSHAVPGLEALADSPHVGPLLRVDIKNGHVPTESVPAIRRRFGSRFAVGGRMLPRVLSVGDWSRILGDGED
jgi:hypothetical protein